MIYLTYWEKKSPELQKGTQNLHWEIFSNTGLLSSKE